VDFWGGSRTVLFLGEDALRTADSNGVLDAPSLPCSLHRVYPAALLSMKPVGITERGGGGGGCITAVVPKRNKQVLYHLFYDVARAA
jgi:hypothetical protein